MKKLTKLKKLAIWSTAFILLAVFAGCGGGSNGGTNAADTGGDTSNDAVDQETTATLTGIVNSQSVMGPTIQTQVLSFFTYTMPEGVPGGPGSGASASPRLSSSQVKQNAGICGSGSWFGPDGQGWYWRSCQWGYGDDQITEYARNLPSPETGSEYKTKYVMGTDIEGKTTVETHTKTAKKENNLYSGFYDLKTTSSGYSDTGWARSTFTFDNYDFATSAGTFEWWSGGDVNDYFPYQRFLTILAIDKGNNTLHVKVTWHINDSASNSFSWEYDCPYRSSPIPAFAPAK